MINAAYDTLILSDLHLGSEVSRAEDALHLLKSVHFRQLILLGDIFCDLNFGRLTREHWRFLSEIRKLSNPKRRTNVVWVEGNHDVGLSNVMSHLVGIPVYQRYVWEFGGQRHLAIHGHQFDRFLSKNAFMSGVFEQLYYQLQRIDSKNKVVSRQMDRLSTRWLRLTEKVAQGALAYAKAGRIDRVFCGHTHVALQRSEGDVTYYNSGSWVDRNATFITVAEAGVEIHEYVTGALDRHTSEERREVSAAAAEVPEHAGLPAYAGYESIRC